MQQRTYIAIDLKSFYASVECVERGLDPLTTNLVVADPTRTEKTICLAVSPSLKKYGISGRARLFEVLEKVREINSRRRQKAPGRTFTGESSDDTQLQTHPELELSFIQAKPRMAYYMKHSTDIYSIYLKYIAPEDIHVYSIDEVLMDVTAYLKTYQLTPEELAMKMILDVLKTTGITATAGIGTNLYLCKIAMDIQAKHIPADENGVRIARLDEMSYRRLLWDHRPLTDFWRVGRGYAKKLEQNGLYTMGDIARCSIGRPNDFHNEELLYKLFGVNAELLIDHAWGWEPCTMQQIKSYRPETNSISSGQVLQHPYEYEKGLLIIKEMADAMALSLMEKDLVTDQITLVIGYDVDNLKDTERMAAYHGPITADYYGRMMPKAAHGSLNLPEKTAVSSRIIEAAVDIYKRVTDPNLLIRRVYVIANRVISTGQAQRENQEHYEQMELFTDYEALERERREEQKKLEKEIKRQKAVLEIRRKFGKNAIVRGMNLTEGATAMERNRMIGGHHAGEKTNRADVENQTAKSRTAKSLTE